MLCTKVQAKNENNISISGNSIVNPGDEVVLSINLAMPTDGILAAQGTLKFDKNKFELIDKKIKKDKWSITAFNEENGMFILETTDEALYDKNSYIYESEGIMDITLKVKDDAKFISSKIELTDVKIVNDNFKTIELKSISKRIKLKSSIIIIILIIIVLIIIAAGFIVIKKRKNI